MTPSTVISLSRRLALLFPVLLLSLSGCSKEGPSEKLRLLTWVGYDEPEFLGPIEEELDVDIEVTTYVGGDQMYTLFTTSPEGTYDVVVVDAEYGERMYREGLLIPLPTSTWYDEDLFSLFQNGEPVKVEAEVYAAVMRWGALGLVFNSQKVSHADASSYDILWSPQLKDRVVVFDWYLPVMGVLSVAQGNSDPYSLSAQEFQRLETALSKLRPQVATIHPGTGQVIADLRDGTAWVGPGIGEWAAAVLAEEGRPIDWIVPKEGGVMWIEGFSIPRGARNPERATEFIRLVREPEHLARLAWRDAYHSQVVRESAYSHLDKKQRELLKAQDPNDIEELISRLRVRRLPAAPYDEGKWLASWQRFKTGRLDP